MKLRLVKSEQQVPCDICGELARDGHLFAFQDGVRYRFCSKDCATYQELQLSVEKPKPPSWQECMAIAKSKDISVGEIIITDAKTDQPFWKERLDDIGRTK